MSAAFDDDVLYAAGNVNLAVRAIGTVTGIYPCKFTFAGGTTGKKQTFCRRGILVITGSCRRPSEPKKALRAIGDLISFVVDDANFVAGKSAPGGNKRDNRTCFDPRRHRASVRRKGLSPDTSTHRAAIARR